MAENVVFISDYCIGLFGNILFLPQQVNPHEILEEDIGTKNKIRVENVCRNHLAKAQTNHESNIRKPPDS